MARLCLLFRLCIALALLGWFGAVPAAADHGDNAIHAPACHAASEAARSIAAMASADAPWRCDGRGWRADAPVAWLRFDAALWQGEAPPRYFFSRTARHERITLTAVDADGTLRSQSHGEAEGRPFPAGPVFQLPLPEITQSTRAVIVRIDRPHSIPLLTEARLARYPENADRTQLEMMVLALVLGMLILPLLFDITFYLVLRERFVIYHAAMVSGMMGYVLFAGGLITVFVTLPVAALAVLAPLSWAIGCGAALLFLSAFLEHGALARGVRRFAFWAGCWTVAVPGFFSLQFHATQAFDDFAYFLTITPAAGIVTFLILHALSRGSRSARFVAVAWAPLIVTSLERVARGLGWHTGPSSLDLMMFGATGIEVVVISLAIADRFLAIRRERDAALTEARMLEQISTRDSLTGLMNRRAIEARFDELQAQGFDTFALVDLDRFKAINDLHGHQVGDAALIACASAIRSSGDRDAVAVRLGGEEFVVLLRGPRSLERAEALRQAIPMRIAKEVPGLDLPVTASMGVVMLGDGAHHKMAFADLYARADALMYEAKASGRNRLAFERLTLFRTAPTGRKAVEGRGGQAA
jgi:diguanylate cyclase (GGDEF)-like protein